MGPETINPRTLAQASSGRVLHGAVVARGATEGHVAYVHKASIRKTERLLHGAQEHHL